MEKNQETLKEIEKKRKELGLSQVELAKRIGFSRGYYNMLIHGKKPVSDKLADQLQNVLQEYRKEKESGYGMQTENLEEGFKSADDVWNIKEAGEMTDEYIEENEDSIALIRWNGLRTWKPDEKATAYHKMNMLKQQESAGGITVCC